MNSDGIIWSALATINTIYLVDYVRRISKKDKINSMNLFLAVLSAAGLMLSAWMIAVGL